MPKIVPKSIQTCFERVLGQFFRKILCPVFHGGSSLQKFSKKSKKNSKFQKCPKSFPKVSKRVLNVFWGEFSGKVLPSFPWSVESSKLFEKKSKKLSKFQPKTHKTVPKRIPKCFEHVLGQIFRKIFKPSVPWRLETSKIFKKIKKNSKFQKCQNRSQKYPNVF